MYRYTLQCCLNFHILERLPSVDRSFSSLLCLSRLHPDPWSHITEVIIFPTTPFSLLPYFQIVEMSYNDATQFYVPILFMHIADTKRKPYMPLCPLDPHQPSTDFGYPVTAVLSFLMPQKTLFSYISPLYITYAFSCHICLYLITYMSITFFLTSRQRSSPHPLHTHTPTLSGIIYTCKKASSRCRFGHVVLFLVIYTTIVPPFIVIFKSVQYILNLDLVYMVLK